MTTKPNVPEYVPGSIEVFDAQDLQDAWDLPYLPTKRSIYYQTFGYISEIVGYDKADEFWRDYDASKVDRNSESSQMIIKLGDDIGFFGGSRDFVVFGKAAKAAQPAKSALYHPSLWDNRPLWIYSFRNVHTQSQLRENGLFKGFSIPLIAAEFFDRWVSRKGFTGRVYPGLGVVDVDGMNHYRQQISHHIDDDVPLMAFHFFSRRQSRAHRRPTLFLRFANQ